jgi:hypothetical protein
MCGLSGIYSQHLSNMEMGFFEDLMVVSNLRGSQGAGLIAASPSLSYEYCKTVGNGVSLCNSRPYKEIVSQMGPKRPNLLIGHTRQPTKGGLTEDAVHPHDTDHVIGVHNGTLWEVNGRYLANGESDSKKLYQDISERGLRKAIDGATGAMALVWIDKEAGTLNFWRNSERPLWFATWGGNENACATLLWSSERIFLEFVCARRGWKPDSFRLEELKPNTHLIYDLSEKGLIKPSVIADVRKIETFRKAGPAGPYGGRGFDLDDAWPDWNSEEWDQYCAKAEDRRLPTIGSTDPSVAETEEEAEPVGEKTEPAPLIHAEHGKWLRWITCNNLSQLEHHGGIVSQHFEVKKGETVYMTRYFDGSIIESNYAIIDPRAPGFVTNSQGKGASSTAVVPFRGHNSTNTSSDPATEAGADCPLPFRPDDVGGDGDEPIDPEEDTTARLDRVFKEAASPRTLSKKERLALVKKTADKFFGRLPTQVPVDEFVKLGDGSYMANHRVEELLNMGCAYCCIIEEDYRDCAWKDKDYLCFECQELPEARELFGLPEKN